MSEVIRSPGVHSIIWEQFSDPEYRSAYAAGHVGDYLASQIHCLRANRNWTQSELAMKAKVTQPQISGWEDSCESVNLTSLQKLAEAFDVAIIVKFVSFSDLAREVIYGEAVKNIPSFDEDSCDGISRSSLQWTSVTKSKRAD